MDLHFEYGELMKDADFVNKCENLNDQLIGVQKILDQLLPLKEQYEKLSVPAQIELDLFLLFMINSLHWVNLRLQGVNVNTHPIRGELQRIKAAMLRWKQVKDRDDRPTVNVEAAKRFVRSGLYDHTQKGNDNPPNKKIKFEDNDK